MLSKSFVAASTMALFTQKYLQILTYYLACPADPAVGSKGISCDFTQGECSAFEPVAGKAVTYDSHGAVCAMDAGRQAPTICSKEYIFFGRVEVEMQAAPGPGVISTIVLLSDDLDEIDWEAIGSDTNRIQSNIFSKGDQNYHKLGGFHPVDGVSGKFHKYTIDWTPRRIEWSVDGTVQRTLTAEEAGARFPTSPTQVKLGAWVAGFKGNEPGTITWAGGLADFSNGPLKAYYKNVKITDYAGGSSATSKDVKEYSYGDHSGSAKSVQIKLRDGSSETIDEQSDSSGSSSASSSSSSTESSTKSSTKSSISEATSASASTTTSSTASTISTGSTAASNTTMSTVSKTSSQSSTSTHSGTPAATVPSSSAASIKASVVVALAAFGAMFAL
ncbi:hypothetical protein BB8028_0006g09650 [Beauveria bassiana]|uniref:Crh-like protein n=1 Tax=Beauveria bassiana TaxID=176275 RepID=A0A2S7YKF2_BEABA|nr:hypothetical protein BB8028_0006g09650 [Beauveria bassiana]